MWDMALVASHTRTSWSVAFARLLQPASSTEMLLNIWQHLFSVFEEQVNMEYILVSDLSRRWKVVENPLYFLAFALHPFYRMAAIDIITYSEEINGGWVNKHNCLSVARLTEAAKFYYGKFELSNEGASIDSQKYMSELKGLGKAMKKWLLGKQLYGMEDDYAQGKNAVVWWDS